MAIEYKIWLEDDIIKTIAKGDDSNLRDIFNYAQAIINEAIKHNTKKILCDEVEFKPKLSIEQAMKLADFISKYADKVTRFAIVCHPKNVEEMKLFKIFTGNRGLIMNYAFSIEEAENWLN